MIAQDRQHRGETQLPLNRRCSISRSILIAALVLLVPLALGCEGDAAETPFAVVDQEWDDAVQVGDVYIEGITVDSEWGLWDTGDCQNWDSIEHVFEWPWGDTTDTAPDVEPPPTRTDTVTFKNCLWATGGNSAYNGGHIRIMAISDNNASDKVYLATMEATWDQPVDVIDIDVPYTSLQLDVYPNEGCTFESWHYPETNTWDYSTQRLILEGDTDHVIGFFQS